MEKDMIQSGRSVPKSVRIRGRLNSVEVSTEKGQNDPFFKNDIDGFFEDKTDYFRWPFLLYDNIAYEQHEIELLAEEIPESSELSLPLEPIHFLEPEFTPKKNVCNFFKKWKRQKALSGPVAPVYNPESENSR